MNRLTEKFANGEYGIAACGENCRYEHKYCSCMKDCPALDELIDRLGKYEDMEQQGELLKLPCRVGDTVWTFVEKQYGELTGEVVDFKVEKVEIALDSENKPFFRIDNMEFELDCLGKTIFHSREEAAEAVKKIMEAAEADEDEDY